MLQLFTVLSRIYFISEDALGTVGSTITSFYNLKEETAKPVPGPGDTGNLVVVSNLEALPKPPPTIRLVLLQSSCPIIKLRACG